MIRFDLSLLHTHTHAHNTHTHIHTQRVPWTMRTDVTSRDPSLITTSPSSYLRAPELSLGLGMQRSGFEALRGHDHGKPASRFTFMVLPYQRPFKAMPCLSHQGCDTSTSSQHHWSCVFAAQCFMCSPQDALYVRHGMLYVFATGCFMCSPQDALYVRHGMLYVFATGCFICSPQDPFGVRHRILSVTRR